MLSIDQQCDKGNTLAFSGATLRGRAPSLTEHSSAIPARPVALTPFWENFPAELATRAGWVVWRYELRRDQRGQYKWTKPPFDPRSGAYADVSDPSTWGTLPDARAAYEAGGWDGAGIALRAGLAGLDLDECITEGIISPLAREALELFKSYAERSPSGRGLRVFVLGELPPGGRKRKELGLELYDCGRYLTVTGRKLHGAPWRVLPRLAELAAFHAKHFPAAPVPVRAAPAQRGELPPVLPSEAEILEAAFASKHGEAIRALYYGAGGEDPSADDQALANHLVYWSCHDREAADRLFRASARMRPKWDAARGETTYGAMTLDKAMAMHRRRPLPLPLSATGGAR